jgi:uncharacterized Zn-finger protein
VLVGRAYFGILSVDISWAMPDSNQKAKKMVTQAPETKIVDVRRIACDGGEGALGHPRVWLQISSEQGWVECPYCDTKMVHKDFMDVV